MASKTLNYPHPVLEQGSRDFTECDFRLDLISQDDSSQDLVFELSCNLDCAGLQKMLNDGRAAMYLRFRCSRTSYRGVEKVHGTDGFEARIPKNLVSDSMDLQAIIVAANAIDDYVLPEFNQSYFKNMTFKLRKGDILAIEPGMTVKFNTILEKDMAGIVRVTSDAKASEMHVHYAAIEDMSPSRADYIYVMLPESEYYVYGQLRTKKYLKHGVERFLQSSLVLPAITEALSLLRREEMLEKGELDRHYMGTIWADSLYAALARMGFESLADQSSSDYELANKLLGNVEGDSLINLEQRLTEWSTIRDEDDVL